MLRRIIFSVIIVAAVSALPTDFAIAQHPQVIHFQGLLTSPGGGPLRTDIYNVNFSIWDHRTDGIEPLWSETQVVEVTDGLFDVFLGSVIALSADVFTSFDGEDIGLRYLEIEVVGDEPMTPRTQIAKTPNSFVSSRVLGDIQTAQGSFRLMEPPDNEAHPAMEMIANGATNSFKINWMEPPDTPSPAIEMDVDAARSSFRLMDPTDDKVGFDVLIGGEGNSMKLMDPSDDEVPVAEISSDGFCTSMKLMDPTDDIVGFDVFIGAEGNSIKMMDPSDERSLIEMNGGIGGEASFYMFNPQPEPPAVLMEMNSSPLTGGSFRMFNPQPEPPEPLLEMNADQYGASLAMAAPGAGGLPNQITDPMFEVNVDSDGGGLDLYDEAGKYLAIEPSPFMPGGAFYMNDPVEDQTNVWIESSGLVSARKGVFGQNLTSDGNYSLGVGNQNIVGGDNSFAGGRVAQANHDNCFVWSDYPVGPSVLPTQTSGDNQFLVRATGGIAFYTNGGFAYGVSLGPDDYSWNSILPPLTAHNSRDVDNSDILNKIEQLPIRQFTAEGRNNQTKHISPVPEDFNRIFDISADDNHISMLDQSGVALAGIQALLDRIEQLEARIAELEEERR
jgi:hypothetical protein